MISQIFHSDSPLKTRLLGLQLAKAIKPPYTILLHGELGAGKTEIVRGYLSLWGFEVVRSPSFTIVNSFKTPEFIVHHIDLFRIKYFEELEIRGILDLLKEKDSVRFIEWPEIIEGLIESEREIRIFISFTGERSRTIKIECIDNEIHQEIKKLT